MDTGKDSNRRSLEKDAASATEKNGVQAALSFQKVRKEYKDFCLDPLAKDEAVELLRELGEEEVTILISSHTTADLEKLADYLAFLHNGKLSLFAEKDGLLERYRTVQGAEETLERLRQQDIRLLGMRRGAFGAWAILDRTSVQNRAVLEDSGLLTERAGLEEIVTCLMKEEKTKLGKRERGMLNEGTFI